MDYEIQTAKKEQVSCMSTMRRKFTPEQKAQIVLEMLKEEKSVSQLASEHDIHANVLQRWKTEAVQNLHQLFVDNGLKHLQL